MKRQLFLVIFTIFYSFLLFGQVQDDFSNGNLQTPINWQGDLDKFIEQNGQLQLKDPMPAGNNLSTIYTLAPSSLDTTTTWRISVTLEFSPSSSNFARVYLAASESDLQNASAAYFVQIGGISGSDDAVELYRQDGNNIIEKLISGTTGAVGNSPALAGIQITRTSEGEWSLAVDYSGGTNYQLEGTAVDKSYQALDYFGFYCAYTSSRSDKFFFDNLYIQPKLEDTQGPKLESLSVLSKDSILLKFDEALQPSIALDLERYTIAPEIGSPISVSLSDENRNLILVLGTPLKSLLNYELQITQLEDILGNKSELILQTFSYQDTQKPSPGDLLVSEIMANPRDAQGLPELEYLELYNNSETALELSGVQIASGGAPVRLPDYILLPNTYLILCSTSAAADFASFGEVLGVSSFPGLSNAGDEVLLLNSNGQTLQSLNYTIDWYEDSERQNGGFSLERIQNELPEDCPGNWQASQSPNGGTPGRLNSLAGITPEMEPPFLRSAAPIGTMQITLGFNETLGSLMNFPENYRISGGLEVLEAQITGPQRDSIRLSLNGALQNGQIYQLDLLQAEDCLGNFSDQIQSLPIALAEVAAPGDIRINEILFNPQSGGKDFVELINLSNKVINLKGMELINREKTSGNFQTSIETDLLLFPDQILALSPDPNDLTRRYPVPMEANISYAFLPSLDASSGNLSLQFDGRVLDDFSYQDDFHSSLLEETRGVSLERLSSNSPTQEASNWSSAAESVGFATPGYQNSQRIIAGTNSKDLFYLDNNTFSPDNDGFEDLLVLSYQSDKPGYLANIQVFDASGRPIKRLARNYSLASEGFITWDGSTNEASKARIGIYILWIEAFTPEGDKTIEKISCVLAGKL